MMPDNPFDFDGWKRDSPTYRSDQWRGGHNIHSPRSHWRSYAAFAVVVLLAAGVWLIGGVR